MYRIHCYTEDDLLKLNKYVDTGGINLPTPPVYVYVYEDGGYGGYDHEDVTYTDCSYVEMTVDEFTKDKSVNHPAHYASTKVECIDAMEQTFGKEAVINFAILNCWKYLWRRKDKGAEEQDVQKALWYFDKAKELINSGD